MIEVKAKNDFTQKLLIHKELFSPSNGVVGLKIIVLLRAVTRTKNLLRKRLLYIVNKNISRSVVQMGSLGGVGYISTCTGINFRPIAKPFEMGAY